MFAGISTLWKSYISFTIVFVQPTGLIQHSSGAEVVMSPSLWWSTIPTIVVLSSSCGACATSE